MNSLSESTDFRDWPWEPCAYWPVTQWWTVVDSSVSPNPKTRKANRALIHAAVRQCGIGYVDFARGYGCRPDAGETYFRDWMAPFWEDVLWATKVGYGRDSAGTWTLDLSPNFLRGELERSLELLGTPIPLMYLAAGSTDDVTILNRQKSVVDSFRPLLDFQESGELQHLGVANVTAPELEQLLEVAPIAIVQNKFTAADLAKPERRAVLDLCRERNIPFVAWGVFQSDDDGPWVPSQALLEVAQRLSMTPQEASIAILLSSSPNFVVLTGVTRPKSLSSSVRAANQTVPNELLEQFLAAQN